MFCVTGEAASQLVLPPCDALIVQVPVVSIVTVVPETVHTLWVSEEKLTVSPEVAEADTVKVPSCTNGTEPGPTKVIVWLAGATTSIPVALLAV
jgi:hypothetical protein